MGPLPVAFAGAFGRGSLTIVWIIGGVVGLLLLDRGLLWMESRGWIYYRRSKPARGASTYHLLEMSSVFDPGFQAVQEVRVKEEQQEDEAGDPLGPDRRHDEEA